MKTVLVLSMLAGSCFAGDLYQHVQLPLLDAYVDSSVDRDPDLPGMGESRFYVSVSLSTPDAAVGLFGVYFRVLLDDGTQRVVNVTLSREPTGLALAPTAARFFVGAVKPVKVIAFYVVRYHPESSDQLIHP